MSGTSPLPLPTSVVDVPVGIDENSVCVCDIIVFASATVVDGFCSGNEDDDDKISSGGNDSKDVALLFAIVNETSFVGSEVGTFPFLAMEILLLSRPKISSGLFFCCLSRDGNFCAVSAAGKEDGRERSPVRYSLRSSVLLLLMLHLLLLLLLLLLLVPPSLTPRFRGDGDAPPPNTPAVGVVGGVVWEMIKESISRFKSSNAFCSISGVSTGAKDLTQCISSCNASLSLKLNEFNSLASNLSTICGLDCIR